jgi:hypothetical protein
MALSNVASCTGIESAVAGKKLTYTTQHRANGEVRLNVAIFTVLRGIA